MSKDCCGPEIDETNKDWKKILIVALVLNIAMFFVEIIASQQSGSMALQADALDFLGDAFNYGISLYVVSHTIFIRAKASILKSLFMIGFALFITIETLFKIRSGGLPSPPTMGTIGSIALTVNLTVAALLFKYRGGDSNMRSVWLCTRNDAIGNLMVIAAAFLVHYTQSGWPDWIAGLVLAVLGLQSGIHVFNLARNELHSNPKVINQ